MQLDTALRLSALGYTDDTKFAEKIMRGEHLNKMKDRTGQQLRDARLVGLLAEEYPWVPRVYADANQFIHLSHRPFFGSIDSLNDEERSFVLHLSAADPESVTEDQYYEAVDAFWNSQRLVLGFVRRYLTTRIKTPESP